MGENFLLFPIPTSRQLITACYSSFKGSKALFDLFGYPNTCVHVYMHMYIPPPHTLKNNGNKEDVKRQEFTPIPIINSNTEAISWG